MVITVNGPGEIAAWLTPVVQALKARRPDLRICVALLPCVFSSGAERSVLEAIAGVDAACGVAESHAIILRNRLPAGFRRGVPTLLLHLGGEVVLSHLIAWRLGCRAFAYAEGQLPWQSRFEKVFANGLNRDAGKGRNVEMIGDLMVDAARLQFGEARASVDGPATIGLFPGSREYLTCHFLPYLAVLVDEMAAAHPELRWVMAKSPFISQAFLEGFPDPVSPRSWRAHRVRHVSDGERAFMETEQGTRIEILSSAEVIARARVAVTLPGTNTGEMAAAGLPMVTLLPTYVAEEVPLPGLPGHVGRIPVVGPAIKRWFAQRELRRTPLLALPNRRAGRKVVPELVGRIDQSEIAAVVTDLLSGDLAARGAEVRAAMGPPGAADRLAEAVLDRFGQMP